MVVHARHRLIVTPWYRNHNGRPPDGDDKTYRWDRRLCRWVDLDQQPIDEDALEAFEHQRRQRIAEQNEY